MIEGRATAVVTATPAEVLALIVDLERYRQADHKIARVRSMTGDARSGEVCFTARLRGLPTPAERQTYVVSEDGLRVDFCSVPSRWPGKLARFHGVVLCEPLDDGTRVTHVETFFFARPLAWLVQPFLRRWLQRDTTAEVARLAALLAAPRSYTAREGE